MRKAALLLCLSAAPILPAADWPGFRGPNASGVSDTAGLPTEFGPMKNVVWKTELPPGHSSPVLSADRIFVTAHDAEKLFVITLDRASGKILWRREVPRPRKQELHKSNSPASPSAVTDGTNVYAFFTDFGLISYGPDGNERWRQPLGPFNNPFGMGASPVLADGKLIQVCDSESGSFIVAVDPKDGRIAWRKERPDMTRGFSTPLIYEPDNGRSQALVAGSYQLIAYDVESGDEVWWVRGLTWQVKPTPVMNKDTIYILGWAGGADTGQQETVIAFEEVLKTWDTNRDGKITANEAIDPKMSESFKQIDLDTDGAIGKRDWEKYRSRRAAQNSLMAVRLGGKGDMTDKNVLWRYTKSLPNAPSPLLYQGVLYLMKEGGIFTSINPADGTAIKQGRLPGALDQYFSSPVGADGKIYVASEAGHVAVVKAGGDWELLNVNDMDDECYATPAVVDGVIYLRTRSAMYCFKQSR